LAALLIELPSRAAKTSWALVPAATGKSFCTWFSAVCDCEPGMVKLLLSWPPLIFTPAAEAGPADSV